jgi:hypothetical protein
MSDDPTAGRNPVYGASLNYWLKDAPTGDVALSIADSSGRTIRAIPGPKVPGVNRVVWDLRFDPAAPARATAAAQGGPTPPVGAEEGPPPARAGGPGGRGGGAAGGPGPGGGGRGGPGLTILAPPGRYRVTLRVNGRETSQPLLVLKDPESGGSAVEIAAQTGMLAELSGDLAAATGIYAGIESVRSQLQSLSSTLAGDRANGDVKATADSLERKFMFAADSLAQQKGGAFYEWPVRLNAKLNYLATEVQSSDRRPTDQARQAHAFLKNQLRVVRADYESLIRRDVAGLNEILRARGLRTIVTVVP